MMQYIVGDDPWAVTDYDRSPWVIPRMAPVDEAAVFIVALIYAAGGTIAIRDIAHAFVVTRNPKLMSKNLPEALRCDFRHWLYVINETTTQRSDNSGIMGCALGRLFDGDAVRLGPKYESRATVVPSPFAFSEDRIDPWFRFEARLALRIIQTRSMRQMEKL